MTQIFKSLETISTGYTVFEKDQVLTHEQLNSLADYADDQIRLTRVKLMGVGVACGLRVLLDGDAVRLSRGVGVTTDGDLLHLDADTAFVQFRRYDESYPAYPPLYKGGDVNAEMLTAYELLPAGVEDDRARPLKDFSGTGDALGDMTALLLMESYVKDEDICSGTDCDNLGNMALNTIKLLLIHRNAAEPLFDGVFTAHAGFMGLGEVVAHRPVLTSYVGTLSAIGSLYRNSCAITHTNLVDALYRIYPACPALISDILSGDPASVWVARLNDIRTFFAGTSEYIQYYYDFLKDLAETYNTFRDLLFGDTTWCAPSVAAFPKHLLLGNLVPGADPDENRTRFYPSPLASRTAQQVEHAKFLLRKLDMMIGNFDIGMYRNAEIRITPSSCEDVPLEERAIPFYYRTDMASGFHHSWNFRRSQRCMETGNYSYHAAGYGATGGAANPFGSQIGRFPFFRIEGHMGKPVTAVLDTIKSLVRSNNLPIAVQAIMAGSDYTKLVIKAPTQYTELHQLHYLLRQDLVQQMDDVARFSTTFKTKVEAEPATAVTAPEDCDCPSIRNLAATTSSDVVSGAALVRDRLNLSYAEYRTDNTWQEALKNTVATAGQFKADLGAVVRTEFSTPFDTLISSTHTTWLPWIDTLIRRREEQEDNKLLLSSFIDRNPGLEHYAGVVRGGTFLLVYDSTNNVIADFMLPYYLPEPVPEPVAEPPLVRPILRPDFVVDNGIKVQPSRATLVNTKVSAAVGQVRTEIFTTVDTRLQEQDTRVNVGMQQLDARVDSKILQQDAKLSFQDRYVDLFQSSIGMLGSTVPRADQVSKATAPTLVGVDVDELSFADGYLTAGVSENTILAQKLALLLQRSEAATGEEHDAYLKEFVVVEDRLVASVLEIMTYLARYNVDVNPGTDGERAALRLTVNVDAIFNYDARYSLRNSLQELAKRYDNTNFQQLVGGIIVVLNRGLEDGF